MSGRLGFPEGKRFACTVFDDTEYADAANTRALYDFLTELGLRTTKSIWVYPPRGANRGSSLEDPPEELDPVAWTGGRVSLRWDEAAVLPSAQSLSRGCITVGYGSVAREGEDGREPAYGRPEDRGCGPR